MDAAITRRSGADAIIRAVERGGAMKLETASELLRLLSEKTDYKAHIAVEVQTAAMLKTIDNESDALETIRRLKEKK